MGKRKAGRSTEALGEYGSCRDDEACDATRSLLGHSLEPTSLISSVQQGERENRTDSTDVAGQCSMFSTAIFIL